MGTQEIYGIQVDNSTIKINSQGQLFATVVGGVSSVSNSDGTLTISPTTGAVVASLNLTHTNIWTGAQTFNGGIVNTSYIQSHIATTSSSPYAVAATDEIVLVTTGASAFTVNLQGATAAGTGRKILIVKADSGVGAITVNRAGADTIEGATTKTISSQYGKLGLISDGTSVWYDLGTGGV